MKILKKFLIIILVILWCEQCIGAILKGQITDIDSESLLNKVKVSIEKIGVEIYSDSSGFYLISQLPEGEHEVTFSLYCYSTKKIIINIHKSDEIIIKDIKLECAVKLEVPNFIELEITSSPELESYHQKLREMSDSLNIFTIRINDLCLDDWYINCSTTLNNNANLPIYITKENECFSQFKLIAIHNISGDTTKIGVCGFHCDVGGCEGFIQDTLKINPYSHVENYKITFPIKRYLRKYYSKYEFKVIYEYFKPKTIKRRFRGYNVDHIKLYADVIKLRAVQLRGKFISENSYRFENK